MRAAVDVMLDARAAADDGAGRGGRGGSREDDRLPPLRDAGAARAGRDRPAQRGSTDPDTGSARGDLVALLEACRQRIDPTVTATVLVEAQTHPEVLEAAREQMIRPRSSASGASCARAWSAASCAPDLDVERAADAFLGSYFAHCYERGRPGRSGLRRSSTRCTRG